MKFYTLSKAVILPVFLLFNGFSFAQTSTLKGKIINRSFGNNLSNVKVVLQNTVFQAITNGNGRYEIESVPYGEYQADFYYQDSLTLSIVVHVNAPETNIKSLYLDVDRKVLDEVTIYAPQEMNKKLEDVSRIPIEPKNDLQNVYVKNDDYINRLGILDVASVIQNISGAYTFATFGGVRESLSLRGFRGVPIYKNGILVAGDVGGRGIAIDMQGVETIQVIKGSSAVTTGTTTSYGGAGGLINIISKTPNFQNSGKLSFRVGAHNQYRPAFDIETLIGKSKKAAFRIDGSYQISRTYQNIKNIGGESFYINPSIAFRPDHKTEVILEMDYLNKTQAFDLGTVNQSLDKSQDDLYLLPKNKFLGFQSDRTLQKMMTATARIKRKLSDKFYVRGAAFMSHYSSSGPSTKLVALKSDVDAGINIDKYTIFSRVLQRSKEREDKNAVVQLDLIGEHLETGIFKHTFQAGFDARFYNTTEKSFNTINVDTIDITKNVSNVLPAGVEDFKLQSETPSTSRSFGFSVQEYLEISDRVKIKAGMRVGTLNSETPTTSGVVYSHFINPFAGVMIRLWRDLNVYANYATTTDPSNAQFLDVNGQPLGNETFKQYEAGIKSSWFNGKLRADLTFYRVDNEGMNVQQTIQDANGISQTMGYYFKGGHIRYQGVELDITGKITNDLSVDLGMARMGAEYLKSDKFTIGSSPKNVPNYTVHARADYVFSKTKVKGLMLGLGYYYVGTRADNDWIQVGADYHGLTPGLKSWNLKPYHTINAQLAYDFRYVKTNVLKNFDVQLILNNVANNIGYVAYRDSNINKIDPLNAAFIINYKF
ncbi:MAG: TonB-dependent receptor [Chitinophagales bacterium]|nr:TonB-dependent receptor [Chitinophagales bacterium]